jgi:hypothetical protein
MPVRIRRAAVTVALVCAVSACDEKLSDVAGPTPNLTPTFSSIQHEIFNTTDSNGRVACTTCHTDNGRIPAGGLVLVEGRSYQNLVGASSRLKPGATLVIPGDPDGSYMVHKLEGASDIVGERMPRTGGPFLTSGQMQIIRRWIANGAAND